jgi:hypothetical protein
MFWQSIWLGVQALGDWHILVGMAGIAISLLIWRILLGLLAGSDESGARMAIGCWLEMLGGPVAQALVVCGFILICFPSILVGRGFTPPAIISDIAPAAIGFALLGCVGVCLLCFVPLLGGFISNTPGVATFLQRISFFGLWPRDSSSASHTVNIYQMKFSRAFGFVLATHLSE